MKKIFLSFSLIGIVLIPFISHAQINPTGLSSDGRVKVVPYDPNNVTYVTGRFGYQTEIVFDTNETVQNVSIGDAIAWQAVPVSNYLFIKPMASSDTNMTVLTNLRSYNFELNSMDMKTNPTYELKFFYPDEQALVNGSVVPQGSNLSPMDYNWKYSFVGDKSQAPVQVFDDNKFTYFKFEQNGSTALPAIFMVDDNRRETLLNYHIVGDYVVINRVAKQFTLRNGDHVTCVFNDEALGDWQSVR